jgi:predicted regulator of Ras-like GTPase activity (Roadblock/LC7/MglB family)
MAQFPQLVDEDVQHINALLDALLAKSEAAAVLFVEKAGYLITHRGNVSQFDTTELATLAANAFAATQFIADRIHETHFTSMYQQGETTSVLWLNIDENSLLVILFGATHTVGAVRYFARETVRQVAAQLQIAATRAPGTGLDLADLNPEDVSILFQRRAS